jgi:hypothetical protein
MTSKLGGTGTGFDDLSRFDPTDMTTSDMVLSGDFDDMEDVNAILEMNREATERDRNLDIKGIDVLEEDDDLLDVSNPTRDGAEPLKSNFSDFLNNLDFDKLKDLPGGQGSGPQPLGSSGSLRGASAEGVTRPGGFSEEKNRYAAPKYYTPQGSVEFQKMVSGLLSNVFGSSIRKPTIRSLI